MFPINHGVVHALLAYVYLLSAAGAEKSLCSAALCGLYLLLACGR